MSIHYERLSPLDNSFLALESRTTHMHVGAVTVFAAGSLSRGDGGIDIDDAVFERLAKNLCYVSGNYHDADTYKDVAKRTGGADCSVAYLAIPPGLFDDVIEGLASAGLHNNGRVVVEKPFGRDLASAHALNEILHHHYSEGHVYRIDHFLADETNTPFSVRMLLNVGGGDPVVLDFGLARDEESASSGMTRAGSLSLKAALLSTFSAPAAR